MTTNSVTSVTDGATKAFRADLEQYVRGALVALAGPTRDPAAAREFLAANRSLVDALKLRAGQLGLCYSEEAEEVQRRIQAAEQAEKEKLHQS